MWPDGPAPLSRVWSTRRDDCSVKKWALSNDFKCATQGRVSGRRMGDREFVNRFLAFYILGVESYRGMDVFLEGSLAKIDKWAVPNEQAARAELLRNDVRVNDIESNLMAALQIMHKAFGDVAYCQLDPAKPQARKRINKALFEVFTVCVAHMSPAARQALVEAAAIVRVEYRKLFEDRSENGLSDLVSVSTGRRSRVFKRYEIVSAFLARMTGEQIEWRNGLYD